MSAEHLDRIVPLSRGAAAHGQVQKVLANCGDSTVMQAGSDLGDLHSRRIDADYDMRNPNAENAKTVTATVDEATGLIETIDRAFTGARAPVLQKTIQHYWTQILRESLKNRTRIT